jgi:phospholipid/cholesterol/gamma-HCH transport system ATP-binding protein
MNDDAGGAQAREAVVSVTDVEVELGGRTVLDGASCSISRGAITCVVGESGCGKTTLLRTILGLVTPRAGSVELLGRRLDELSEEEFRALRLRTGVLFQDGALLKSLTAFENVAMPLDHHTDLPEPIIAQMVRARLTDLSVVHAANRLPAELSGGMKKRIALARALMLEPEVLFLDEPSAGLDPVTSGRLDRLLASLRDALDATLILVTHELRSIRAIADEIVFLEHGKVAFQGSVPEAERSAHRGVQRFFSRES